jgi:hypothetical protein
MHLPMTYDEVATQLGAELAAKMREATLARPCSKAGYATN